MKRAMNSESIQPPLHLIICREPNDQSTATLANAIPMAFRGKLTNEDTYLATISDLPVPIRSFCECPTDLVPSEFLDKALHTLVVLLVNQTMQTNSDWIGWIKSCEEHIAATDLPL